MYANYIGVRRGDCAALLTPVSGNGFQVFGGPTYLVGRNLSVRVTRAGRPWFVWKKEKLEASPARLEELRQFAIELDEWILGTT
jgi:hypothetical protein